MVGGAETKECWGVVWTMRPGTRDKGRGTRNSPIKQPGTRDEGQGTREQPYQTARDKGLGTRDKEQPCHPERSEGTHLSEAKELT